MDLPTGLSLTRIFAKVAALKFEFDGTQDLVAMTQRPILGQNSEKAILQRCYFIAICQHGKQIPPHMNVYVLRFGDIWEYSESSLDNFFRNMDSKAHMSPSATCWSLSVHFTDVPRGNFM